MKQLVLKALSEHFRDTGATTQQLLAFFRDGWGRDIARQNLSPQLSRLYQEGRIGRIPSARGWFLIPDEIVIGFRPYLLRGRVIWAGPEVADNEYEPLLAHLHRFRFAEAGAPTEGQRPYRLRHRAFHAGRLQRAGEIVWLLPSEASDHHEPVAEDD